MEALLRGNHFRAGSAVFFSVAGMPQRCTAVPLSEKLRIHLPDFNRGLNDWYRTLVNWSFIVLTYNHRTNSHH